MYKKPEKLNPLGDFAHMITDEEGQNCLDVMDEEESLHTEFDTVFKHVLQYRVSGLISSS